MEETPARRPRATRSGRTRAHQQEADKEVPVGVRLRVEQLPLLMARLHPRHQLLVRRHVGVQDSLDDRLAENLAVSEGEAGEDPALLNHLEGDGRMVAL